MKKYKTPETEIIDVELDINLLAGSTWGVENEDDNGPGQGGDDGPPPVNMNSLWDEE